MKTKNIQYYLDGPIQAEQLRAFLLFVQKDLDDGCERLDLLLQSSGGSVSVALAFAEFLLSLPCEVRICNLSDVDSAAVIVFAAGKERFCPEQSSFFLHPVGKEITGVKTAAELRLLIGEIEHDMQRVTAFLARRTGTPAATWLSLMEQTTSLTSSQALSLKLSTAMKKIDLQPSSIQLESSPNEQGDGRKK